MNWLTFLGLIAGVCTTSAIIPQLYKAWRSKKVADLSPKMFFILTMGVGLWTLYGVLRNDIAIILTNGISFSLNATMLVLYFKYKTKN